MAENDQLKLEEIVSILESGRDGGPAGKGPDDFKRAVELISGDKGFLQFVPWLDKKLVPVTPDGGIPDWKVLLGVSLLELQFQPKWMLESVARMVGISKEKTERMFSQGSRMTDELVELFMEVFRGRSTTSLKDYSLMDPTFRAGLVKAGITDIDKFLFATLGRACINRTVKCIADNNLWKTMLLDLCSASPIEFYVHYVFLSYCTVYSDADEDARVVYAKSLDALCEKYFSSPGNLYMVNVHHLATLTFAGGSRMRPLTRAESIMCLAASAATVEEDTRSMAEERKSYMSQIREMGEEICRLREENAALRQSLRSPTRPLEGEEVLVVGDPAMKSEYRSYVELLGGSMSFLDGITGTGKAGDLNLEKYGLVVVVTSHVKHKLTERLKCDGIVFCNGSGPMAFKKAVEDAVAQRRAAVAAMNGKK